MRTRSSVRSTTTTSTITSTTTATTRPAAMSTLPLLAPSPPPTPTPQSRLMSHDESKILVPWQTDNEYVLRGYRRRLYTIPGCLWSAVAYVHNETVNIHSHSIGSLFFAILLPLHVIPRRFPSLGTFPAQITSTLADKLSLGLYLVCAVSCLSLSSWFHTVQCHSKDVCDAAHRGDYIGIVVLIVGSILPGMYYGFYGNVYLQAGYMGAILAAGLTSGYIVLSPHHRSHRWHRTLTFIGLGLSAVVPVTHIIIAKGLAHAREGGLDYILAAGASYIFGALLYAARIPERFSPGTFDYFGSSHQIFHIFVLAGAWFQYAALRTMVIAQAAIQAK